MTAESVSPLVSTAWLEEHLHEPGLRIFDTSARIGFEPERGGLQAESGRDEWARAHIPGSGFVDLLQLADAARPSANMLPPGGAVLRGDVGARGRSRAPRRRL